MHRYQGWAAAAQAVLNQLGYGPAPAAPAAPTAPTAPAPAPAEDALQPVLASLGLGNLNLGALNNLDLSSLSSIPGLESLASVPGLESLFGSPASVPVASPGIVPSRSRGKGGKAPKGGKSFGKGKQPQIQDWWGEAINDRLEPATRWLGSQWLDMTILEYGYDSSTWTMDPNHGNVTTTLTCRL